MRWVSGHGPRRQGTRGDQGSLAERRPVPTVNCERCGHEYHGSGTDYQRMGPDGDEMKVVAPDPCSVALLQVNRTFLDRLPALSLEGCSCQGEEVE